MLRQLWYRPAFWAIAVLLWAALLWWLSSRSFPPIGPSFNHADKVKHFVYFTAGSFCAARFLHLRRPPGKHLPLILIGVVFALIVGAVDEYHQTFTPGRSGNDPGDLLADVVGGLAGALLCLRTRAQPGNLATQN